ncbi:hypothetical protein KIPB_005220 [Kipferlia bialata]|uniref:SPRY domain-containing protein n=1 Tax=Kipferlia bialata TaxID=797122 RepID=A0A391NP11_9EUKA|nr:hypothetical protein KIPB_005220 [Kipferlia bialata]|eukprot:g5220.t1
MDPLPLPALGAAASYAPPTAAGTYTIRAEWQGLTDTKRVVIGGRLLPPSPTPAPCAFLSLADRCLTVTGRVKGGVACAVQTGSTETQVEMTRLRTKALGGLGLIPAEFIADGTPEAKAYLAHPAVVLYTSDGKLKNGSSSEPWGPALTSGSVVGLKVEGDSVKYTVDGKALRPLSVDFADAVPFVWMSGEGDEVRLL